MSTMQDAGRGPTRPPPVDTKRIEAAVREILKAIGEDADREGLRDTPARVARSYAELFSGLHQSARDALETVFREGCHDIVVVRDIRVASVCEHHLLPFVGNACIAYIPGDDGAVVGLSKLARLVDVYARRPQVQERLTAQIADALMTYAFASGALVSIDCEHTCMSIRGVRKTGASTATVAARGLLGEEPDRSFALAMVGCRGA